MSCRRIKAANAYIRTRPWLRWSPDAPSGHVMLLWDQYLRRPDHTNSTTVGTQKNWLFSKRPPKRDWFERDMQKVRAEEARQVF